MKQLKLKLICLMLLGSTTVFLFRCSDEAGNSPTDQGVEQQVRDSLTSYQDQAVISDAFPFDQSQPDIAPLPLCYKKCQDMAPYLCVYDKYLGTCQECTSDEHCQKNPNAFGNKCDVETNRCICDSDDDCKNSPWGSKCEKTGKLCSCLEDKDCSSSKKCHYKLSIRFETLVCKEPCTKESDCTGGLTSWHCNLNLNKCVQCANNGHCTDSKRPLCSPETGTCGECIDDSQCTQNPNGNKCIQGECHCSSDNDCNQPHLWGSKCDLTGTKKCICASANHCIGNQHGPLCNVDSSKCSCKVDADCTVDSYTRCGLTAKGLTYAVCQKPCTSDNDCTNSYLKTCNELNGKCVECLEDNNCLNPAEPFCTEDTGVCSPCLVNDDCHHPDFNQCNDLLGTCASCLSNEDCEQHSYGKQCRRGTCACITNEDCKADITWGNICDTTNGYCGCKSSEDCKQNTHGVRCEPDFKVCSCQDDNDCTLSPYTKCAFTYAGVKLKNCRKPCTTDDDCVDTLGLPKCKKDTGRCVACREDQDCSGTTPFCYAPSGICVECRDNTHCAQNTNFKFTCDYGEGCVECLTNEDCGPASLGKTCDNKMCMCFGASDCSTNGLGNKCDNNFALCRCYDNQDCSPDKKCIGSLKVGDTPIDVCRTPCQDDAECRSKNEVTVACDQSTGKCLECINNNHCQGRLFGTKCQSGNECGCESDQDCNGVYTVGSKCDMTQAICGCTSNADCIGNSHGPYCLTRLKICVCKSDADCKVDPYSKCDLPYPEASFTHCMKSTL